MTGYNVRLREPPRIRICLVQANLGKIIPKALCPAAKRALSLLPEKRCEIAEKQLKRDRIRPNPLEYFFEVLCIFAVIFYAEARGDNKPDRYFRKFNYISRILIKNFI